MIIDTSKLYDMSDEDMQARLGRLEDDSRRARGTDTEE